MTDLTCSVEGCEKPVKSRGWCSMHAERGESAWAVNARKTHCLRGHEQVSENSVERTVLLGIVLAEMRGVQFDDVARVLRVPERKLERLMHGEEMPPTGRIEHWTRVAQILHNLHKVLDHAATGKWLNTRIASLDNRTPIDCISRGQEGRVLDLTLAYLDPSFS